MARSEKRPCKKRIVGVGEAAAFGLGVRALYYDSKAGAQGFVAELNLASGYAKAKELTNRFAAPTLCPSKRLL